MTTGTLLIVDDEPRNLAAMRQILSQDHPLAFARSGDEALAVAMSLRPGLILLDIQMPGMDGYVTCRKLKEMPQTESIPVIFVTSMADVGDEERGFSLGAVDYIIKPVSPPIVRARVRTHLNLVRANRLESSYVDAIGMLGAAGHFSDTDTGQHIWRMASYSRALAEASGWNSDQARLLELAAPMHDTGKIGIPDAILKKPAGLSADEWSIMKTHCRIGHDILARSEAPIFRLAAEIALRHHEKWDGTGYPDGLSGDAIPMSARIVAVADVFDALTMRRVYKAPWSVERAIQAIQEGRGEHFDPRLVECFSDILPALIEIRNSWAARADTQTEASLLTE